VRDRRPGFPGYRHPSVFGDSRKERPMEIFDSWWFMIIMAVLLLGLVGVLMFLRNKKEDE
jgi:LPXTG-motif cell wall-anchored protein